MKPFISLKTYGVINWIVVILLLRLHHGILAAGIPVITRLQAALHYLSRCFLDGHSLLWLYSVITPMDLSNSSRYRCTCF